MFIIWIKKIGVPRLFSIRLTQAAHEQSYKQYLKTIDEIYDEFRALFSDRYDDDIFYDMCEATADIIENASAAYDLSDNYAPKYDMTPQEREKYGDTLTMFSH